MKQAWLLVAGALATSGCTRSDPSWLDREPAPAIDGLDVTTGAPFHLAQARGNVVLLSFGYTACAEVCPDTFATAKRVFAALGVEARRLSFVYVTVDPERDDPAHFGAFMAEVDPRFHGVYIDEGALAPILDGYHVVVRKRLPDPARYARRGVDPAAFYSMDHTAGFWGVDRRGRLCFHYDHDASDAQVIAATRRLLEES